MNQADPQPDPDAPTSAALRDAAVGVIRTLREAGHVAYLAGGCVRDALLGRTPKDYDVATDAPPPRVRKLFPRSSLVGESFGVVLTYHGPRSARRTVEVATFRAEGVYSDGRHPDEIQFTDAKHDAQRRDFTVNGLFADPLDPQTDAKGPSKDRVIDYVGGVDDLKAGVIRAIGEPARRFGEDDLRMLRAVRFAARLGFTLEPGTANAIRQFAPRVTRVSPERVGQEVLGMLTGPDPAQAVELLQTLGLCAAMLNEPAIQTEASLLRTLADDSDAVTRLMAWTQGLQPRPELATLRRALVLSNEMRDGFREATIALDRMSVWSSTETAARKRLAASTRFGSALRLAQAGALDRGLTQTIEQDVDTLTHDGIGLAPEPWVTGDDLIVLGFKPGPAFRDMLHGLYDRQLVGELTSRPEAMQAAAALNSGDAP